MDFKSMISTIYPNPSLGPVTVNCDESNLTYEVFNPSGGLIHKGETDSDNFNFDLSNEPNGTYFLRVLDASKNYDVKKVVLAK
jgi:hypothetical protein